MSLFKTLKPQFQENAPWKKGVWAAIERLGPPTKKWDAFRYNSLMQLNSGSFKLGSLNVIEISSAAGIIALPLNSAMRSHGALLLKEHQKALKSEKNPYALLNTAFASDGLFIYVPPGKTSEMEWTLPLIEEGALQCPKVQIFLGKGAHLSIKYSQKGEGTYFYNQHVQFTLDEGAVATLDEELLHSSDAFAMHTIRASLKAKASLNVTTLSKGAKLQRHDIEAFLEGERSHVDLKGLSILSGKEEIHQYINVRHVAPKCESNQHYKTALLDEARSSFEGKIFVEKEAQETLAYQLNNNLLLSPKASAMSKPNLEILADDVKASHGATCTRPQEEEVFYLMARGLSRKEAEWILAKGFCYEIIRDQLVDRLLEKEVCDDNVI
ncbi:MAG: SufD family Fe-S cluster assembly protein [Simkaniaceae bacterium]|nr:SufD family Fe-S cluster assembly protein [Simkaniaceae bacterium]